MFSTVVFTEKTNKPNRGTEIQSSLIMPAKRIDTQSSDLILWSLLGRTEYKDALALMKRLAHRVERGEISGILLFMEHPPIITLGRRATQNDVIAPPALLKKLGYRVFCTDRGGMATCHGPGQLIGYLVLDLSKLGIGIKKLVECTEETLIRSLISWGVEATGTDGMPGIWVGGKKIAAIGMRVKNGVTSHGFALNLNFDLRAYDLVVPCGIKEAKTGNVIDHSDSVPSFPEAARVIAENFSEIFGVEIRETERVAITENFAAFRPDPGFTFRKGETAQV